MCDGQPATDCEIMSLTEFNSKLNDQLTKLDDQFAVINEGLKLKKEAFIEMYKKDPRFSQDVAVSNLHQQIKDFNWRLLKLSRHRWFQETNKLLFVKAFRMIIGKSLFQAVSDLSNSMILGQVLVIVSWNIRRLKTINCCNGLSEFRNSSVVI